MQCCLPWKKLFYEVLKLALQPRNDSQRYALQPIDSNNQSQVDRVMSVPSRCSLMAPFQSPFQSQRGLTGAVVYALSACRRQVI